MRNDMRPELSQKNPYWIGKHRYYELKHFCLQYPIWKKARLALDGLSRRPADLQVFVSCGQVKGDPTERCAQSRIFFGERMEMVEQAAIEAEPDLYPYLLRGVTEELSYDALKMKYDIPCCRDVYYAAYRRFFWLLAGCGRGCPAMLPVQLPELREQAGGRLRRSGGHRRKDKPVLVPGLPEGAVCSMECPKETGCVRGQVRGIGRLLYGGDLHE